MGYTTGFDGELSITPPVKGDTLKLLKGLNKTRRMKRNGGPEYGVEGEFYIEGDGEIIYSSKDKNTNIIDYNQPPSTQPGLWCQWEVNDSGDYLEWDGGEKFYNYVEWMEYLIEKVFAPSGHVLNGEIEWQGEDRDDAGIIVVEDNKVTIKTRYSWYLSHEDAKRVSTMVNSFLNHDLKELVDDAIDRKAV